MRMELTSSFQQTFPDGVFGALVAHACPNRLRAPAIEPERRRVETQLRERFPGNAIDADPIASAYAGYFRRFGARYLVVHQAKTVIGGRPIASASALVEAMFTAELGSLVLTSGHDLKALNEALLVDVAQPGDTYTKLSGKEQALRAGDMVVRDAEGIIASVVHGPDHRTRIRDDTAAVLFGAWCPRGIPPETVDAHLLTLAGLLRREWPEATVGAPRILAATTGG